MYVAAVSIMGNLDCLDGWIGLGEKEIRKFHQSL